MPQYTERSPQISFSGTLSVAKLASLHLVIPGQTTEVRRRCGGVLGFYYSLLVFCLFCFVWLCELANAVSGEDITQSEMTSGQELSHT